MVVLCELIRIWLLLVLFVFLTPGRACLDSARNRLGEPLAENHAKLTDMSKTQSSGTELLTHLAPIVRGLLMKAGNGENLVILKSLSDEPALAFAETGQNPPQALGMFSQPPMRLPCPRGNESDEELRAVVAESLQRYEAQTQASPEIICVPGAAVFRVLKPELAAGRRSDLSGRIALVTGAAGAIGYGICRGLLQAGCHLVITDLAGERFDSFVSDFRKSDPDRVLGVPMDVTSPDSVAKAFATVSAAWGGVDIIVLNAGIALACRLVELELDVFRRLERVNIEGTLLVLSEAGRHFARQNSGGDIILVSTKNVFSPGAGFGAYSATKAAAHQLARIASLEFAPMDVRVNMVAPDAVFSGGAHKSGLWAEVGPGRMKARGLDEKGLEEYYRNRNLLKAKVTAEHVANAVLFFALRQTPTTGACIPVDGGLPDATPR